ncbi:hypothetical protein [Methylobacterium sp. SD21]|uniref:hypothetical protein n=1 Tax=Methylobacterium litchii TaxID=3138810 RepID=UPI00313A846F
MTISQIASAEGWSESTIQRHCHGLGIRFPSRAVVTLPDIQSILSGRETAAQVADRRGVTRNAVYMAGIRAGMRIRRSPPSQLDLFQYAA